MPYSSLVLGKVIELLFGCKRSTRGSSVGVKVTTQPLMLNFITILFQLMDQFNVDGF
jgi:hypothetical protein